VGRVHIVVEPATLRMSWPDLLRRQVRLTTVRADALHIDIAPRPPDAPDSVIEPLVLPVAIVADQLEVGRLLIRRGVRADGSGTTDIVPVEIGPITLQGALVDGEVRIKSIRATLYGISAEAYGTFGTGEPYAINGRVEWQLPEAGVTGAGKVSGDLAALRFEQVLQLPAVVGVGGVARLLQDDPEIVAEARWTALRQSLSDGAGLVISSDAGTLRVRGWPDRLRGDLKAGVRLGDWPKAAARATFSGDWRQLQLGAISLDGFGGQITGTGRISLDNGLAGGLQLRGKGIDPRFLDPRLAGRVQFRSAVTFDRDGNFRVEVPEASGTLFQRPLRASGAVAREQGVLIFDDVRVNAGVNRVAVIGRWGDGIDGRFSIDAQDLATLWPGLEGRLQGAGTIGGTAARPNFDLNLTGSGVGAGDLRIVALRGRGGLGARQRISLAVEADGVSLNGRRLGNVVLGVDGPLDAHTIDLALSGGDDVAAELRATGAFRNGVLAETIGTGSVTVRGEQRWSLREPATVRVAGADLDVTAHCWTSGSAELCVADSRFDKRGFSGNANLRSFPLSGLAPFLPADIDVTGTATATITVQREGGRLTGALRGGLEETVVTWRVPDDEPVQTAISEFSVDVSLTDEVMAFDGVIAAGFGLRLAANGRVNDPFGEEPTITADVTGGVPDVATLGPVLDRFLDVGDVRGRITVDAKLSGKARQPDIAGGLQLEDGSFTVPAAGITVDRISLALLGREDGQVALKGNARSGKGFVALEGTLAWRDQLLPTAEATVKGRVIDVIRLPEGLVQVSPDVRVVLRDRQLRVSGTMLVPRAEIRLKKLDEAAVEPSDDTVVHGRQVAVVEKSPPLFVLDDLQVRLGENVTFEGFGLKTGLAGGLRLNQSLRADPRLVTGAGVVTLTKGQFTAFGTKLGIDRGSLIFSGIVTDPGIDVKASRDITYDGRDVTVGVLLSGTLSRIETKVYSEPAMGELDALSYLTTGKPLSAAGAGDRSMVSNAALSLGLNQALPVVQQLGSALNVDEVGLDTSQTGGTAVVVGEQLGKNLMLRYSYGIFDKLGTVKATYKLGRRVSIEATSGQEQALDLIYSVTW
ncbi:MAG: translocation/assembly module TamB domain-containing protein, partial [Gammaproteobacteria bacterium]